MRTLNEYQTLALRTAKRGFVQHDLIHVALGLSGEAGEFADAIKKNIIYKQPLDDANAAEELGDLLWYVALGAAALGLTLEDVANLNVTKLQQRYPQKYTDELAAMRLDKQE